MYRSRNRGSNHASTATNSDGAYVVRLTGDTRSRRHRKRLQKFTAQHVVLSVAKKPRRCFAHGWCVSEEVVVTVKALHKSKQLSSENRRDDLCKQVAQLELNGRNFTQLVTLTPASSTRLARTRALSVLRNVALSVTVDARYNNWELDGGDNMDNGSQFHVERFTQYEAIAEFKVLTLTMARNTDAMVRHIEVETKSARSPCTAVPLIPAKRHV